MNKPAGGNRGNVAVSIGVFRRGCHSGSVRRRWLLQSPARDRHPVCGFGQTFQIRALSAIFRERWNPEPEVSPFIAVLDRRPPFANGRPRRTRRGSSNRRSRGCFERYLRSMIRGSLHDYCAVSGGGCARRSAYIQIAHALVRRRTRWPFREAVHSGQSASWRCGISTSARSRHQTRRRVRDREWRGLFSSGEDSAASNEAERKRSRRRHFH